MSFSGDVVVNPLVYEGLRDLLKGDDAGSFLKGFIGIVEEFGFFDAHHEPIVNFLFDQKGEEKWGIVAIVFRFRPSDRHRK